MPPSDDQQNANPFAPQPSGDMSQPTSPAADPSQSAGAVPPVGSAGGSDASAPPFAAAPGFSSAPDIAAPDDAGTPAPSAFDAPAPAGPDVAGTSDVPSVGGMPSEAPVDGQDGDDDSSPVPPQPTV